MTAEQDIYEARRIVTDNGGADLEGGRIAYTLPSGRRVTLRMPTMGERDGLSRRLLEEYRGDPNAATRAREEVDMLLCRQALTGDSGSAGGALDPDPKHRCTSWDVSDMTAYVIFFSELTNLSEDEVLAAREAAKSVKHRIRSG